MDITGDQENVKDQDDVDKSAKEEAVKAFEGVLEHGPKIELDHHLVYYARTSFSRLVLSSF